MTRFSVLIILNLFLIMTSFTQTDSVVKLESNFPIDDDITYKGGESRLYKIIKQNLTYPQQAILDSIEGTVIVYFAIDTIGRSTEIKIVKGIREDIDKEAIRCVDLLDEWTVGKQNSEKISLHHMLPIKFSLKDIRTK